METLKKAWKWLKDHSVIVISVLAAIVSAIFTLLYTRRDGKIDVEKSKAKVSKIEAKIAHLEANRKVLGEKYEVVNKKDQEADKRIADLKKQLKKEKKAVKNMTAEEKLKKFEDMGY